jgi:CHAD domain-containing protein
MAEGKWIPGLTSCTPVAEAAARVLAARLDVVTRYLPLAVNQPHKDVEHVHQLRVATRRTAAALRIFADCVPAKIHQKVKKQVRRIRRAAAQARDWDVFLAALAERESNRPASDKPGLDFLRGVVFALRLDAQRHLNQMADRAPDVSAVLAEIHSPSHGSNGFADLALPAMQALFVEFAQAISGRVTSFEQLHRIRILGKRLRYAMEIFADCFAPAFREKIYPEVEQMQEILGNANDSNVAAARLTELRDQVKASRPAEWSRLRPGVENLLKYHRQRLPQERRRFGRWLTRWKRQHINLADLLLNSKPAPVLSETA